jgi:hypothetical protein
MFQFLVILAAIRQLAELLQKFEKDRPGNAPFAFFNSGDSDRRECREGWRYAPVAERISNDLA